MIHLFLIRHAESHNNALQARLMREKGEKDRPELERLIQESRSEDPPISARGQEQAARLGAALREQYAGMPSLVLASPMRRSLETANAVARELATNREDFWCHGRVFEIGGCHYKGEGRSGMSAREIEAAFPVTCREVGENGWFHDHALQENDREASQRVQEVGHWLHELGRNQEHGYKNIFAILHGDLMDFLLRGFVSMHHEQRLAFVHSNCGITELVLHPTRGALLLRQNDLAHLPRELHTSGKPDSSWWCNTDLPIETSRFIL